MEKVAEMCENSPIRIVELFQLSQLGIRESCIGFNTVSLASKNRMCILQKLEEVPHVFILDIGEQVVSFRHQTSADSAIMCPVSNILAVKSKGSEGSDTHIQVVNLDTKSILKNFTFNFKVIYWKWATPTIIAIVTELSVYHLEINENSVPVKLFDRLPAMNLCQIINYQSDCSVLWSVLSGLAAEPNRIVGYLQLYSFKRKCSQLILGHTPCFVPFRFRDNLESSNLFCFISNEKDKAFLRIIELQPSEGDDVPFPSKKVDFSFQPHDKLDFPILAEASIKYGLIYILTKYGFLYVYDLESATCLYINKISSETVFVSAVDEYSGSFIGVNKKGLVISVAIDEDKIIDYMANVLHNYYLAARFASRNNILSSQDLFISKFNELFEAGQYLDASRIAATAPGMILRTSLTISKFKMLPKPTNAMSPLSLYFRFLLEEGCLTKFESLEMCHYLIDCGRKDWLEMCLVRNKFEFTEELGDLVDSFDTNIALSIYLRSSTPNKVVKCFAKLYQFDKIFDYSHKVSYYPDYISLIQDVVSVNPDKGVEFSQMAIKRIGNSIDLNKIADIFMSRNLVSHCTISLFEALLEDNPQFGHLQTRLLEINLISAPNVAEAILASGMFSYYDKNHIAYLCEKNRLYQWALQLYSKLEDIKRVIVQFNFIDSAWLVNYFGTLTPDDALVCLNAVLLSEHKNSLYICLQVAIKYYKELTVNAVIHLFESLNIYEGLFHFLNFIIPEIIGELLDLNESEEYLISLIQDVTGKFSINDLVCQVEKRNKLQFLRIWLEKKSNYGSTDAAIHTALCKIYIDNNNNPESFLKENEFYDCHLIGNYCEQRNPCLAAIAFEKGCCDFELMNLYRDNSMHKQAAAFLVHKKSLSLWSSVLSCDGLFKEKVIEHTIKSILIHSRDLEEIDKVIEAFTESDLSGPLVNLLETLLRENELFSNEQKFQNTLLSLAIKVDKTRVMDLVQNLNNYLPEMVADYALKHGLFEEAFVIYKKFHINNSAMDVLLNHLSNFETAKKFAESCDDSIIWGKLVDTQLKHGFLKDAINSSIKAKNIFSCEKLVQAAQCDNEWLCLVTYLEMALKINRDPYVESELLFAYAKCGQIEKLGEFISEPNNADINSIADRCFNNNLYKAAKLLYSNSHNFSKLAITLLLLKEFGESVDSAKKANQLDIWKEVCFCCIKNEEFKLAHICAINIVVNSEGIDELVTYYEEKFFIEELLNTLEVGICQKKVHMGIFTHLAILYSKYKPEKMKGYLDLFWSRMNIPKVLNALCDAKLWENVVFIYEKNDDYSNAILTIINHPISSFKPGHFKKLAVKVSNSKIHLKCIQFYLDYQPLLLNDFLIGLAHKLDNPKIVEFILEIGHLALVKDYLLSVQHLNNKTINEAVNDLCILEENFKGLKLSIETYTNFDWVVLANRIVNHEIMEFRRIAAQLLKVNQSWQESIQLCKENGLYSDAIGVAFASKLPAIAEELAEWFLQEGKIDCFGACLFQCFDLLLPDVVLELSWRYHQTDLAMPYLIQALKKYTNKVDSLIFKLQNPHLDNCSTSKLDRLTTSGMLSIT